jgi:hypothetical protein
MFLWPSSPDFSSTQWNYPVSDFSDLSIDLNSALVNSRWVGIEVFPSDQPRPSLGAFFATPETLFGRNESYSLYSCTVDARWAFTQALLDASSGQALVLTETRTPMARFSAQPLIAVTLCLVLYPVFTYPIAGLLLLTRLGLTP